MAIRRAPRPEHHFTQIRNDVLRDDRLSYRARGLLAVILSHHDDWATSAEELSRRGSEGRDAIRTALQELEDAGYLRREKRRDGQGRIATHQVIYDTPHLDEQPSLFPQVAPTTENQASVFQPSVNQPSVSQAPIEHHPEQPLPTVGGAKPKPLAQQIAEAHYEHAQGMCNFMAVRQMAARALKVKDATPERIVTAMNALYDAGRPITFQTLGQHLAQTGVRETNQNHWANGGQF